MNIIAKLFPLKIFGFRHHQPLDQLALDSAAASDVARLHSQGGFARGWSTTECESLLADKSICADGARARDGRIAAACLSRQAGDEAEILVVLVEPALRGMGAGRNLMATHLNNLSRRGVRRVFLEVDEENAAARALYARHGFVEAGHRPGYYPKADGTRATALVLRRDLE
jgi:[ribosomal protein S18]-alanine N-acetyltransferase